jgi:hypothetical protein
MVARKAAWPVVFALGCCLGLVGCLHTQGPAVLSLLAGAQPGPAAEGTNSKEEIPLVPLPPLPFNRGQAPERPAPPAPAPPPPDPPDRPGPEPPSRPAEEPGPATPARSPAELVRRAEEFYGGMDSYIARLRRRERLDGKDKPEEVLLFKFRKQPWSVYCKWIGERGRGREVIYVKGHHENKIHTLLAAGDHPFLGAGQRLSLAVNSLLVRSASRHPITEAGIGANIDRLAAVVGALARGDKSKGTLEALGPEQRPEFGRPAESLVHNIPAGCYEHLPKGGRRFYWFDPETGLPVLVSTHDHEGQQTEYYCYDRLLFPVKLDDSDFDPDIVWRDRKQRP